MMKEQCLCLQDSKKDDEVAVPVCVQENERYYPTPPHPTPPSGSYLACGGKQNQSLVAVRTFKDLTAASDWFLLLQVIVFLLPQVIESYCRKWRLSHGDWDNFKIDWWSKTRASHSI